MRDTSHRVVMLAVALALFAARSQAAENLVSPSCWEAFAPRPANAPTASKTGGDDLGLTTVSEGKRFVYGGWRCRVEGIAGGSHYTLRARAVPVNVESVRESLTILLRWKGDFGSEVAPTYVWDSRAAEDGANAVVFERHVQAPARARAVEVQLVLQWSAAGRVTWQQVSLMAASPPEPRKAKVAAVWFRPRGTKNGAESVARVAAHAETIAASRRPDVILLGEMINHAGSPGSVDDDAEPIPGPTTERLGALARKHSAYVAFGMLERSGSDVFNTAVLLDRTGSIAGTYRKVQLPFEEVSAGVAPGDSFPVFRADFGKVGLLICHDTSFVEPARELALKGVELILVPIWGGRTALVRARAIENGVYLATSGYDYDSEIVDPTGAVLATVPHDRRPGAAVAEIDFNKTFPEDWTGDWRDTVNKQRRKLSDAPEARRATSIGF